MTSWYVSCLIGGMLTCTFILSYTIVTAVDFIVKHMEKGK